jgi:hypothetical protein
VHPIASSAKLVAAGHPPGRRAVRAPTGISGEALPRFDRGHAAARGRPSHRLVRPRRGRIPADLRLMAATCTRSLTSGPHGPPSRPGPGHAAGRPWQDVTHFAETGQRPAGRAVNTWPASSESLGGTGAGSGSLLSPFKAASIRGAASGEGGRARDLEPVSVEFVSLALQGCPTDRVELPILLMNPAPFGSWLRCGPGSTSSASQVHHIGTPRWEGI